MFTDSSWGHKALSLRFFTQERVSLLTQGGDHTLFCIDPLLKYAYQEVKESGSDMSWRACHWEDREVGKVFK